MRDGAIRYRTARPDLSHLPIDKYSWDCSVSCDAKEDTPNDTPAAKGNMVDTITHVDANLSHNVISSKSVTGVTQSFKEKMRLRHHHSHPSSLLPK